jgi:hypothetical protein
MKGERYSWNIIRILCFWVVARPDVSGHVLGPIICVQEEYLVQVVQFCRKLEIHLFVLKCC